MSPAGFFPRHPSAHGPGPPLAWDRAGTRSGSSACQAADEWPSVVHVVNGIECLSEGERVTVVDPAVLELTDQVAEHTVPVLPSGRDRRGDLDAPLDDPDGGQALGGRPGLLPRSLPARPRAPLREPPGGLDGDRTCAPAARSCGRPPRRRPGALLRRWGCAGFGGGGCARPRSRATRRPLALACPPVASAHAADGPDACAAPCHPDPSRRIDGGRCMRCSPLRS
ncbi:MAG: hypothetical protein JWP40_1419 [Blastococcus sp.]|nr:hypothetical protein [Blastococcus sp.]